MTFWGEKKNTLLVQYFFHIIYFVFFNRTGNNATDAEKCVRPEGSWLYIYIFHNQTMNKFYSSALVRKVINFLGLSL